MSFEMAVMSERSEKTWVWSRPFLARSAAKWLAMEALAPFPTR
jgi:hypothetical protein